ncbi:MAG: GAF domain-containing protein [Anaerolineae bacterium]
MADDATQLRLSLEQAREALRQTQAHNAQLAAELERLRDSVDVAARDRDQQHLHRLMRTLTLLSDVNQSIVRTRDLPILYQHICDLAVEKGGYVAAWIGRLSNDGQQVFPYAVNGLPRDVLERSAAALRMADAPDVPVFIAARTKQRVILQNIENYPGITSTSRELLTKLGARSGAVFPLIIKGIVRGTFTLYSPTTDSFSADEIRLLDEMAGDIAFAMEFGEQAEQQQRDARRLEVLHAIDLGLLHGDSIPVLVAVTVKHLRQLIPCQQIRVTLFNETLTVGTVFAANNETPTDLLRRRKNKPISPTFLESLGLETIRCIDDLLEKPELRGSSHMFSRWHALNVECDAGGTGAQTGHLAVERDDSGLLYSRISDDGRRNRQSARHRHPPDAVEPETRRIHSGT